MFIRLKWITRHIFLYSFRWVSVRIRPPMEEMNIHTTHTHIGERQSFWNRNRNSCHFMRKRLHKSMGWWFRRAFVAYILSPIFSTCLLFLLFWIRFTMLVQYWQVCWSFANPMYITVLYLFRINFYWFWMKSKAKIKWIRVMYLPLRCSAFDRFDRIGDDFSGSTHTHLRHIGRFIAKFFHPNQIKLEIGNHSFLFATTFVFFFVGRRVWKGTMRILIIIIIAARTA